MTSLKTLLVGSGLLAFMAVGAVAADMDGAYQNDWSGLYIGLQGGGIIGEGDANIPLYPSSFGIDPSGFAGGIYAGYDYMMTPGLLLGLEGDFSGVSADKKELSGGFGGELYHLKQYWDASIRVRLGMPMGNMLPYVTGGVAVTRLGTRYIPGFSWDKKTKAGWTIGAGLEMQITENLTGRLQYRYADYGKANFMHAGPSSVDYSAHIIQAGFGFRF